MPLVELSASDGGLLRVLRATRHVSQQKLAQRTGIAQSKIWQFENNFAKPTVEQLAKIWSALSTD